MVTPSVNMSIFLFRSERWRWRWRWRWRLQAKSRWERDQRQYLIGRKPGCPDGEQSGQWCASVRASHVSFFTHDTVSHKVTSGRSVMIRLYIMGVWMLTRYILEIQKYFNKLSIWFFFNHSVCTVTVKLILVKCFPLYSALNVWTHFFPWWRHQIEMEPFSALLALCRRSPVNSRHKGQWRGASIFSLICAWRNGLVNNQDACDLTRHYVVTVMHTA